MFGIFRGKTLGVGGVRLNKKGKEFVYLLLSGQIAIKFQPFLFKNICWQRRKSIVKNISCEP